MTVNELHYDFLFKIDKVNSLSKEDFYPEEIDWLLNEAQNVLIKTRYTGNNPHKTGFEVTQKRSDDLSSLVVKYPEQPLITPIQRTSTLYEVDLSTLAHEYWFFIRGTAELTKDNCTTEVSLRLINHDDLNNALNDPFNNSGREWLLFNFGKNSQSTGTSIYIYPGEYTPDNIKIEYIKKPTRINLGGYLYIDGITYTAATSELPEQVHSELVDIAVQIASGIIENPDYVNLKTQKVFSHE